MLNRIMQSLGPPVFADEAQTRVAGWIHTILLILVIGTGIIGLLLAAFEPAAGLSVTVASGLCYLGLFFLFRRGHVRAVSILLPLQLLVAATWAAYVTDSFNAGAITAYFLSMVVAALLLGGNAALISAALSILALWGLLYIEWDGLALIYGRPNSLGKTIIISAMLGSTAILLRFTIQQLNRALERTRRSERALAQSNRELEAEIAIRNTRLYKRYQQRALEQETLREVALALTTTLDHTEVVERILAHLQEVVPYDTASVQLLRTVPEQGREGGYLEIVGGRGFPNPKEIVGLVFYPNSTDNPNREVVRTQAPHIVDDAPAVYKEFRRNPHAPAGIRSWLGVPMLVGEQLVGMIALDKSEPGFYTQEHARLAEAFAAQAAIAIENSRLFQAEREQRELTEALARAAAAVSSTLDPDRVLDRILEQVERVVAGDAFLIVLIEDDVGRVARWRVHRRLGIEHQLAHLVLPLEDYANLAEMKRTGEPLVISDTVADPRWTQEVGWEWIRSYVGVTIRVTGSTIGFLAVYSTRPGQFDLADARRLETFANHAAAAIENARLHQKVREHADQLERRVQERTTQVQAQYARLDAILRSTTDGIVVTDGQGNITLANPVAQTWLARTLSPEDARQLRQAIRKQARKAVDGVAPEQVPQVVLELTGLDLVLNAAPVIEETAEEPFIVVAIHNVSHLRALDRMKARFVANVSHELRTPIATIKLHTYLMQRHPQRWREYLDPLVREVDHQAQLVESILQISRIDAGRLEMAPQPTSLNELVRGIVASHRVLAQESGLTLKYRSAPPLASRQSQNGEPIALIDPERIVQVLNNLVGNAIRYTPEGGTVTISTDKQEADGRIWATVEVSDTGIGIPPDELPHIFDRFFRGEQPRAMQLPGTGLGLSIVQEIVELHGGRVTVSSEQGLGSTFSVWLPVAD